MFRRLFRKKNGSLPDVIEAVEDLGDIQVLRFKGVLDKTTLPDEDAWVDKYIKEQDILDKNILVDLGKVRHVDSSAVAEFIYRLNQFKSHGRRIALINVPEEFRRLLEIDKITDEIVIYKSEKTALEAMRP